MKVQFLSFDGCPNAAPARAALHAALAAESLAVEVEELDIAAVDAPAWARAWGSPTILIDGRDSAGATPTEGDIGCRLYAGGTPAIAQLRAQLRDALPRKRSWLPMVGAIAAALAASACCVVPAVLAIVGLSGAGFAARFAPLRPIFLAVTAVALAVGMWNAYRTRPAVDACGCAIPRRRRWTRVGLWLGVALTIGLAGYPLLAGDTAVAGAAKRGAVELRVHVAGMDCAACAPSLARRLARVAGVVTAEIDYPAQLAIVSHDGTTVTRDLLEAIEDLGYQGTVR